MYQTGDLIVYGSVGVCRVEELKKLDSEYADNQKNYYVLKPLYGNCMVYSPEDNTRIYIRPVITRENAEQLIDMIPMIQTDVYHSRVLRELTEHYEAIIDKYSCGELIELTMSIYAKKKLAEDRGNKLGAIDSKFMKQAEALLFGELAVALDMPKAEVPVYIEERVSGRRLRKAI
ncbi:MAG: CarD family transcriptional regulator [Clostridiales Family XIII bacterium]|nr:CarD family transcriptional regulator [Clostridiales Family XIII bacterium]